MSLYVTVGSAALNEQHMPLSVGDVLNSFEQLSSELLNKQRFSSDFSSWNVDVKSLMSKQGLREYQSISKRLGKLFSILMAPNIDWKTLRDSSTSSFLSTSFSGSKKISNLGRDPWFLFFLCDPEQMAGVLFVVPDVETLGAVVVVAVAQHQLRLQMAAWP